MRWVRVEDNEEAWEYALAGLLWFGTPEWGDMNHYPPDFTDSWEEKEWLAALFNGIDHLPNYIQVDD